MATAQRGSAFAPVHRRDLDRAFALQQERVVNRDHTATVGHRLYQIVKTRWRVSLAGCRVTVHGHLDGRVSIG